MPVDEGWAKERDGYTRSVLDRIRQVLEKEHGMRDIVIRPVSASAARLSIPIRIYFADRDGERRRAFGKILGSTEPLLERSIQLVKNVYLRSGSHDPIFGSGGTAREMAEHQFRTMDELYKCGVPTARPLGCHDIGGGLYILVSEFLEAAPITEADAGPAVMDEAFSHLSLMHRSGLFHGDIKPENLLVGDRVYILDVGRFREAVPAESKGAYDLACMMCSFLGKASPEAVCEAAGRHYSRGRMRRALEYLDLVRRRPDIGCSEETTARLAALLS